MRPVFISLIISKWQDNSKIQKVTNKKTLKPGRQGYARGKKDCPPPILRILAFIAPDHGRAGIGLTSCNVVHNKQKVTNNELNINNLFMNFYIVTVSILYHFKCHDDNILQSSFPPLLEFIIYSTKLINL